MEMEYAIQAESSGTLIFSYVGFIRQELLIGGRDRINVTLAASVSPLDEVRVIAYGTTTQRLTTGSESEVTSEAIEKQPVTNPLAALQGQVAGVFIQTVNGLPGGNIKVQIRGQGSIASGTDPLYIIDDVPFLSAPLTNATSA